ncbi:hypothetical protein AKJ16_DCAP14433, partial [Drosera capensis]
IGLFISHPKYLARVTRPVPQSPIRAPHQLLHPYVQNPHLSPHHAAATSAPTPPILTTYLPSNPLTTTMRVEVDVELWRLRSTDLKLSPKKLWYLKLSTAFSCLLQRTVWSPASEGAWKYTMAQLSQSIAFAITVVFVTLASRMEFSVCSVVKAFVSCMDCGRGHDLSGIRAVMECNNGNKLATATTTKDGVFEAHLPLDPKPPIMVSICLVKLLGANEQFYALKKNMVSEIAMAEDNTDVYTTVTPLTISRSCSSVGRSGKCRLQGHELSSSKTVNLPVPSVYGLPPTSFYVPLFPIIGIP